MIHSVKLNPFDMNWGVKNAVVIKKNANYHQTVGIFLLLVQLLLIIEVIRS